MKKIFLGILVTVLAVTNVRADINKLYFTEKDKKIYYNTDMFDDNSFMVHTDMLPGEEYVDELVIENGTETDYKLFLKAREIIVESDEEEEESEEEIQQVNDEIESEESDEELEEEIIETNDLLDHIIMRVEVDGEVVYEGYARGIDYGAKEEPEDSDIEELEETSEEDLEEIPEESSWLNPTVGVNLQDAIYIGTYPAKSSGKIVVTTMLEPEYEDQDKRLTRIDWDFYANYEVILPAANPNTLDDIIKYMILGIASIVMIFGIIIYKKQKV